MTGVDEPARELLHGRFRFEQRLEALRNGGHQAILVRRRRTRRTLGSACPPRRQSLRYRRRRGDAVLAGRVWRTRGCILLLRRPRRARVAGSARSRSGTGRRRALRRHADTLTPPRGWHLQDRRPRTPRLWVDRPPLRSVSTAALDDQPAIPTPRPLPARCPRRHRPVAVRRPVAGAERARARCRDRSRHIDGLLDARTPLLARAFAAARLEPGVSRALSCNEQVSRRRADGAGELPQARSAAQVPRRASDVALSAAAVAGLVLCPAQRRLGLGKLARHRARSRRGRARTSSHSARPRARARLRASTSPPWYRSTRLWSNVCMP